MTQHPYQPDPNKAIRPNEPDSPDIQPPFIGDQETNPASSPQKLGSNETRYNAEEEPVLEGGLPFTDDGEVQSGWDEDETE